MPACGVCAARSAAGAWLSSRTLSAACFLAALLTAKPRDSVGVDVARVADDVAPLGVADGGATSGVAPCTSAGATPPTS
jgi:hypothetical protein